MLYDTTVIYFFCCKLVNAIVFKFCSFTKLNLLNNFQIALIVEYVEYESKYVCLQKSMLKKMKPILKHTTWRKKWCILLHSSVFKFRELDDIT